MKSILESVADRQAIWSETANFLKAITDRARYAGFGASFLGALFAALASINQNNENIGTLFAVLSAISLAFVTFVMARWLNKEVVERHLRVRRASEALKNEAYLYATHSGIYVDTSTREALLLNRKSEIETGVSDLLRFERNPSGKGSCPRTELNLQAYIEQRVDKQIEYFNSKSMQYNIFSRRLHILECVLSLSATLIAASAALSFIITINFTAMVAVLTTLGGIVVSHLEASRFDKLIPVYRATAIQLENIKFKMKTEEDNLRDWVTEFESVLMKENSTWLALWTPTNRERSSG